MREAAFGIVFNETRTQVLLVKRRDVPIWVLPGGGIDEGESSSVAAIREVKEETGLNCSVIRQVALYQAKSFLTANTYLYELKDTHSSDSALSLSDETVDIGYFDINKLPRPYFPIHLNWIHDALIEQDEAIVKPLEGVSVKAIFLFALKNPGLFLRYIAARLGFPINRK